jgi:hypothetical protein
MMQRGAHPSIPGMSIFKQVMIYHPLWLLAFEIKTRVGESTGITV